MSQRVKELELENAELKRRIALLESASRCLIEEKSSPNSKEKEESSVSETPTPARVESPIVAVRSPPVQSQEVHKEPVYAFPQKVKLHSTEPDPQTPPLAPAAKFNDSLKRFRAARSGPKEKKTKAAFSPAKLLSKKLLKLKASEEKAVAGNTPSTSSSSLCNTASSQYDNLDGIITTLQKMMSKRSEEPVKRGDNKSKSFHDGSTNIIGQKLATHNDKQLNYDRIMSSLAQDSREQESELAVRRRVCNPLNFGNEVGREFVASSEDISSLSTVSQESSSSEHIYYFNPVSLPRDAGESKKHFTPRGVDSNQLTNFKTPIRENPNPMTFHNYASRSVNHPTSTSNRPNKSEENVSKLLEQLSGESGYMVLSGRDSILHENPHNLKAHDYQDNLYMETTYGNVSKLMEALRAAEAKDSMRKNSQNESGRRETFGHAQNQKIAKSSAKSVRSKITTGEKQNKLEYYSSRGTARDNQTKHFGGGTFGPQNFLFSTNLEHSQETYLLNDTATTSLSGRVGCNQKTKIPDQRPNIASSNSVKYYQPDEDGVLSGIEIFDPYPSPQKSKGEKQRIFISSDARSAGDTGFLKLSEDLYGQKRNNYHIVSHPLNHKKQNQIAIRRRRRNIRHKRPRKKADEFAE